MSQNKSEIRMQCFEFACRSVGACKKNLEQKGFLASITFRVIIGYKLLVFC